MPDEWIETTLGEIAEIQMGLQLSPSRRVGKRPKAYLRAANIVNQTITTDDVNEMNFTAEEEARFRVSAGDTLLVEGGNEKSLGMPAQALEEHAGFCIQNTLVRLRTRDRQRVGPTFLHLICRHLFETRVFEQMGKGTTILHLGGSRVPKVPCRIPGHGVQRRIVDLMGAMDAYVSAADARVAAARAARTALLTDLCSRVDRTWESTTWGSLGALRYGKSLGDLPRDGGPVEVFGTNGPIGWTTMKLGTGPTVIVGRKGAYRGVHLATTDFWVIDTAFWLETADNVDPTWAYFALSLVDINSMDSGSAIPSLSRDSFNTIPVHLPPLHKQLEIVDTMRIADAVVHSAEAVASKARIGRSALLTDLLSGAHEIPASYDRFLEAA